MKRRTKLRALGDRVRILTILLMLVIAVVLPGCSRPSSGNRVGVAGTVTRGGTPLGKASITFIPEKGATGVGSGGAIQDGKYSIPAESGPTPGIKYEVLIQTIVGIPDEKVPRDQFKQSEQFKLTAEIPPKGSKELNFTVD